LRAAAWIVLVLGVAMSLAGGATFRADVDRQSRNAFNAEASDVAASLASSLSRMNDLTTTMRTFVATRPSATNRDWSQWYASLDISQRYPSVVTFAYAPVVTADQLPAFIALSRSDPRPGVDQTRPMTIIPPGKRPYYCLVRLGSFSGALSAIPPGLDICAVAKGKFLEIARDTGRLSVTPLVLDGKAVAEILAPVYQGGTVPTTLAARRAKVIGIVGGVFDVEEMLRSALRTHPALSVELLRRDFSQYQKQRPDDQWLSGIVDRGVTATVGSVGPRQPPSSLTHDVTVSADGTWVIRVSGAARTGLWSANQQGLVVLGSGLVVTLLLFSLVTVLSRGRQKALDLVARRTAELQKSEERFRSLAASSPIGILQTDDAGNFEYANDRLCRILDRGRDELAGTAWADAFVPEDREKVCRVLRSGDADATEGVEARIASTGEPRWVRFSAAALTEAGALTGRVSSVEDVTAEILSKNQLTREARHDALTGLPNRVHFLERLTQALEDIRETRRPLAVLFIDLDRFKQVNDAHGHAAGDELLIATAHRLSAALRPGDLLARLGGDEFAALLPGVDEVVAATVVVDRLQAAAETPFEITSGQVSIGASVGLVLVEDPDGDPAAILQDADMAMYRAKSGSTRFEIFDVSLREGLLARLETEQSLSGAIERDELTLAYQPVIDLQGDRVAGCEALLRWNHPTRGLLLPGDFLPLAESTGRIVPIGSWVLDTAIRTARTWSADQDLWISVNFSAQQLAAPDLLSGIQKLLDATAIDPGRLYVEILETHLLETANVTVLRGLKALGVRVAIDDFGAGHSGLLHLKRLPADIVKIDSRLVADLAEQPADRIVVSKIVEMAHDLGLTVVAEGVESQHQAQILRAAGCDMAQGFLWSPGIPAADFEQLLLAGRPVRADGIAEADVGRSTTDGSSSRS
jgi:diguanylate cyclase (GGDEF)-like protein/PAS domain S-box-containing protein